MKLYILPILLLIGSIFSASAYFPRDTVSTYTVNTTNSDLSNTLFLSTSTRTILNIGGNTKDSRIVIVSCGTSTLYYNQAWGGGQFDVNLNTVCTQAIYVQVPRTTSLRVSYVNRNRTTTEDPAMSLTATTSGVVSVSNFPSGFNINNFPSLQPVAVNNFPSLQDTRCVSGCQSSSTLILASSTIEILTTTAPTFQEWMLVVGVFLAINAIHMWNFLFRRPKTVIRPNKIYK